MARNAFVRGVRGMLFKKMVLFGVYFAAILSEKIVKMFIFYTKVIDIVLLRSIYRSIGAYSPECLFIVPFGASWNVF